MPTSCMALTPSSICLVKHLWCISVSGCLLWMIWCKSQSISSIIMYSSDLASLTLRSYSVITLGWCPSTFINRISRNVCRASQSSLANGRMRLIAILPCCSVSIAVVTTPYDPRPKILASDKSYRSCSIVNVWPDTTVARSPLSAAEAVVAAVAVVVAAINGSKVSRR